MSETFPWRDASRFIIGVIDLKDGLAVHAVAGNRAAYQAVGLADGSPTRLVAHYRSLGVQHFYVADLDAIAGRWIQTDAIERILLADAEASWLVDIGWSGLPRHLPPACLLENDRATIVGATETMVAKDCLDRLVDWVPPTRVCLSLDFVDGRFVSPSGNSAEDWIDRAADLGVRQMIVLDLKSVGTSGGPITTERCRLYRNRLSSWTIISGGGIRSRDDVDRLIDAGCDAVLVATALHQVDAKREPN